MTNKGLGRGLESLLGLLDNDNDSKVSTNKATNDNMVCDIDMALIDRNPQQPRKNFDPTSLQELADSIKIHGVFQPILVNDMNGRYVIVAGERRFRASKLAGLKTIPAIVKKYTNQQIKEISLIENLQREDLNPIESARAMKSLLEEFSWTQDELADRLGKSRPNIANSLRLLTLAPEVIEMVECGKLSAGHARSLVVVANKQAQIDLAKMAVNKRVTVRDMERAVKLSQEGKKEKLFVPQSVELVDFKNKIENRFATKVNIKGNDKKGRIIIDYYSPDDLDRIYDILFN